MTKAEAIKALQIAKSEVEWDYPIDYAVAIDMAIKGLEQPEIIRCKDCQHANECHKSVQFTRNEPNTITIGYSPIEWCSRGERREE